MILNTLLNCFLSLAEFLLSDRRKIWMCELKIEVGNKLLSRSSPLLMFELTVSVSFSVFCGPTRLPRGGGGGGG